MMQRRTIRKKGFDLSSEIHALAKKKELGEFRKVYPVLKRSTNIWMIGQICVAWGIIMLGIVVLMIAAILFSPNPPSLLLIWGVAILGFFLLLSGFYMSFSRKIYSRWQVVLWQYGFIYEKKQICQVFRWDQIENVQKAYNGLAKIIYGCKVRRQDGYEVKLVTFSDLPELIDVMLEEVVRHFAPQELNIVSSTRAMMFIDFNLNREGFRNAQEALSWQEIQEFVIINGIVTLRKKAE